MSRQLADRQAVAEPLVRQLVGDQPLGRPVVLEEVGAEDRQSLRLERDLQVVLGDHRPVGRLERVVAEEPDERRSSSRPGGRTAPSHRAGPSPAARCRSARAGRPAGEPCSGRSGRSRGTSPSARPARRRHVMVLAPRRCSTSVPLHRTWYAAGAVSSMAYVALSEGRSLHGNHDGAPCGCAATITPSVSSSQPASPSGPPTGAGWPAYAITSVSSSPTVAGRWSRISSTPVAMGELRRADAVDGDLGHRQPVQVEDQALGVLGHAATQGGSAGQSVVLHAVAQDEVVGQHVVPEVAVSGDVGVGRSAARWLNAPGRPEWCPRRRPPRDRSGCRSTGSCSGTDSPRITRDTGPTVACWPMTAAGRITLLGPERRAGPEAHHVHAQHPIVEQVRLHHAPLVDGHAVPELDQVGLGQPVGLAPHATADSCAQRAQPDVEGPGPGGGPGEPGRGDHLDERVGQLVAPHEAAPERVLGHPDAPDQCPLRGRRDRGGDRAPRDQDQPAEHGGDPPADRGASSPSRAATAARTSTRLTITGTNRHTSTRALATLRCVAGW